MTDMPRYFPEKKEGTLWLERALCAVGLICLGAALVIAAEGYVYQLLGRWQLDRAQTAAGADSGEIPTLEARPATFASDDSQAQSAIPTALKVAPGTPVGRISIPDVGVDAVILEGVDGKTLRRGAGRFPHSAMPGTGGNVALAAHRDTFFRGLRDIREGHRMTVTTADGREVVYRVESTEVVEPTRVDVVDDVGREALTLVTCYPFSYVGPAPQRFVVRGYPEAPSSAAARPI